MFNEIYMEGPIQQVGFHSGQQSDAPVIDFFVSRTTIANPEYMFNFRIYF
jgi:hypothetical protein